MEKIYIHARLKLRIGGYDEFCEAIKAQVPVLEKHGWKLVGAWTSVVGQICTVIDLWELPDANTFFDALALWRGSPELARFREVTTKVVIEEEIQMMRKVPYSP